MIFYRLKTNLRNHSPSPAKLAIAISLALIIVSWPLPIFFNGLKMQFFGIPFIYFYIIIISPLLILLITSWAVGFADKLDRTQLDTENE